MEKILWNITYVYFITFCYENMCIKCVVNDSKVKHNFLLLIFSLIFNLVLKLSQLLIILVVISLTNRNGAWTFFFLGGGDIKRYFFHDNPSYHSILKKYQ